MLLLINFQKLCANHPLKITPDTQLTPSEISARKIDMWEFIANLLQMMYTRKNYADAVDIK